MPGQPVLWRPQHSSLRGPAGAGVLLAGERQRVGLVRHHVCILRGLPVLHVAR